MPAEVETEAGLWVPLDVLEEMRREALERIQEQPVNLFHWGRGLHTPHLGNQPADETLLDEGIRGWAATAGTAVASRISGLELLTGVKTRNEQGKRIVEPLEDHIQQQLYEDPNPLFDMSQLLWLAAWHLQQNGRALWQILYDPLMRPAELWPLRPQDVTRVSTREDPRAGYIVRDLQGQEIALESREVVEFFRPDPLTLYSGLGKLGPQQVEFDGSRYMEQYITQHFKEDGTPTVMLTSDADTQKPDPDEMTAFMNKWRKLHNQRYGESVGTPALLPPGLNPERIDAHSATSQIDPMAQRKREQILSAYGVPTALVGIVEDVNRANAEASRYVFDVNTVEPYTKLIEQSLTRQLSRQYDDDLVSYFAPFVEPDREQQRADEAHDLVNGVRNVQQVLRDRPNGEPDDAPWGEYPIMSLGMTPYTGEERDPFDAASMRGHSREQAAAIEAHSCGCGHARAELRDARGGADDHGTLVPSARPRDVLVSRVDGGADRHARHRAANRNGQAQRGLTLFRAEVADRETQERRQTADLRRYVPPLSRNILRVLRAQYDVVVKTLTESPPPELVTPNARGFLGRATPEEIAEQLLVGVDWDQLMVRAAGPELEEAYVNSAERGFTDVAKAFVDAAGDVPASMPPALPEISSQVLRAQTVVMAQEVNAATRRAVTEIVAGAVRKSATVEDTAKLLEDLKDDLGRPFGRDRARRIARTESIAATEGGQYEGWRQTKQVRQVTWFNNGVPPGGGPGEVRPDHYFQPDGSPLNGVTVPFDSDFTLGNGEQARYPRDPRLSAGNRVNCKCWTTAVVGTPE